MSTGDGGCDYAGDSGCFELNDAARDRHVLLGKILRVTRDGAIPAGNPCQGAGTARCNIDRPHRPPASRCQETFAWGLRNPFRLAFDPNSPTTRFFINDVGEITWEEIDLGQAGADYGWNVREGFCATGSTTDCGAPPAGMTNPLHAYNHEASGCYAITGGAFVPKGIWSFSYDDDYLFADLVCRRSSGSRRGWTAAGTRRSGRPGSTSRSRSPSVPRTAVTPSITRPCPRVVTRCAASGYSGADRAGYPRPLSASPLKASLVLAYAPCSAPNRTHGPPLSHPACSPPVPQSQQLSVGTVDSNGEPPAFVGSVRMRAQVGDPTTTADEADVGVVLNATDVRRRVGLGDYTGELGLRLPLRITDRENGGTPSSWHGTVQDTLLDVPVQCTSTPSSPAGSTCAVFDHGRGPRAGGGARGQAHDLGPGGAAGRGRRRRRPRLDGPQHAVCGAGAICSVTTG